MLSWMWAALLIAAACLSAAFVYTRKLLAPLEDVRLTAARIAGGRLDQPAEITGKDETAALAELINDIAANQQEILLHLWNQTGNSIQVIDRLQAGITGRVPNDGLAGMKKDLASIRSNMENLRALVNGVEFFQVKLSKNKVSASSDPCCAEQCETDPSAPVGPGFTKRPSTAQRTRY
jgi:methyl-accepting chemotaxis protein